MRGQGIRISGYQGIRRSGDQEVRISGGLGDENTDYTDNKKNGRNGDKGNGRIMIEYQVIRVPGYQED